MTETDDLVGADWDWADALPEIGARRMAVRVKPAALRELKRGHPWVFDESIRTISHEGAPGDLAVVFDNDRRFVAIGLWDPGSPIRLRIVRHREQQTIDAAWWAKCLDAAWEARAEIRDSVPATTGWRWVNGESDGFGGLVIDRYGETSVVKIYSEAWFAWLVPVVAAAAERSERVVLRLSRNCAARAGRLGLTDGMVLVGEPAAEPVQFFEHGLIFEADVVSGQKTGHFLDQRENRQRVRTVSTGRSVLDVFSCTGGFSIHAAAGGATEVTSVDVSGYSMDTAQRNWDHNVRAGHIDASVLWRPKVVDAFEEMERLAGLRERFGIVVVDPPSFAPRDRDRSAALGAYRRLASLAIPLVEPGGTVVLASCSSRVLADEFFELVETAIARSGRSFGGFETHGHAADHAANFAEGAYLKAVIATLL